MAGLQITITDAGRAALPNGPNTGTSAVTISHVGVSSVHTTGSLKSLIALPGEVKRVTTFGGDIVADDVIHVTINDETSDVYSVRAFGLYLSTGVLFAVFSSPDVVVEKSAGAMVLLSADITFKTLDTAVIQFGGTGFINPPATTERVGVVELATWEEAAAGARADVVVTPFGLLKTLQSWATNFAAAVHRHALGDIDGLPEALAGKAAAGHKHDASDTISGTFDVGRIPALAMEKITGLATALAGKAAAAHTHAMSQIDGLTQALAGKAAAAHTHVMGEISGLTEALAGKAAAAHTHIMSEITGLTAALALKATLNATARFSDIFLGAGNGRLYPEGDRIIVRSGAVGDERYFSFHINGTFEAHNGPVVSQFGRCWDPQNFNPADKASAIHSHDWGQITGKGDVLLKSATNLGVVGTAPLNYFANAAQYGDLPTGWTSMMHPDSFGLPGGYGYLSKVGRRDGSNGWTGVYLTHVGEVGARASLWFGSTPDGGYMPAWSRAWDNNNLKFATGGQVVDPAVGPNIHDQMLSPASLWAFARNLGMPAYFVIPGTGMMIQCGVTTGNFSEGQAHTSLPVAFGGGCIAAVAIPQNASSNLATNYFMQVVSKNLDRIVFYANRSDSSSGNISGYDWVAYGRVSGTPDPAYSSGSGGGGGGGYSQVEP